MCGNHDEEDVREEEDEALDDEDEEEEEEEEEVTVRRPVVMQIEDKIALRAIVAADPLVCVRARVSARVCMRVCECECLWVCFSFCLRRCLHVHAQVCVLCARPSLCAARPDFPPVPFVDVWTHECLLSHLFTWQSMRTGTL